jgi:hypothetical protein
VAREPALMAFYVDVTRNAQRGPSSGYRLVLGPFRTHGAAVARVEEVRRYVRDNDRDGHWYGYGTCRHANGHEPGVLNDRLGADTSGAYLDVLP